MSSSPIRAVFFDAVGTLIHPHPIAASVYHAVGSRWGSRLGRDEIGVRFRSALAREDELDRSAGWKTSEGRERERWQRIVGTVLDDVADVEVCFNELWQHFSRPDAWRWEPGVESVLGCLRERGLAVGVASNFDGRLRSVLAGMSPLRSLWRLVISSEVGWRKPAPQFFSNLIKVTGLNPDQILVAGDDPINDVEGAKQAGLWTVLLGDQMRVTDLPDLLERLR
jgi:putative hydrolase of the HAD superfamily